MAEFLCEEFGHVVEGLGGFGELEVVPEGVGKRLKDNELGVNVGAEEGAMEKSGVAEEQIARAGNEQSWGQAFEIGEEGREDGIFAVGVAGVFLADRLIWILGLESAGKAVQGEELHRVGGARVIGECGEEAQGGGQREIELLEANGDFTGEDSASGSAEDADFVRLVRFEELLVNGDDIIDCGGKRIFGSEAVVDGDDFDFREIGDGVAFDERAGIGIEAAAVKIDEDEITVGGGSFQGSDDIGGNSGGGGGLDVDGEEALRFGGLADAPLVGAFAARGKVFRAGSGMRERGQPFLGFGADGGGHGNDAGDVRGAVGIEGGGILRKRSDGSGLRAGE